MGVEKEKLKQYAVVEMMGHLTVVGLVTESDISGGQLLRVDVLGADGNPDRTEYIGVGSIYCLTIVSEQAALAAAAKNAPKPAWAWNIPVAPSRQIESGYVDAEDESGSDDDDDDDNPY